MEGKGWRIQTTKIAVYILLLSAFSCVSKEYHEVVRKKLRYREQTEEKVLLKGQVFKSKGKTEFFYYDKEKNLTDYLLIDSIEGKFYFVTYQDTFILKINDVFRGIPNRNIKNYWAVKSFDEYHNLFVDFDIGILLVQMGRVSYEYWYEGDKVDNPKIFEKLYNSNLEKLPPPPR